MISGDTAAAQGFKGAFYNTLKGFHKYWERIDIICPYIKNLKYPGLFNNVFFHPLPPVKILAPLFILKIGRNIFRQIKPELIIVHAYGPQLMSWGGWLLSKETAIPLVLEVHHIDGYPIVRGLLDRIFFKTSCWFFRKAEPDTSFFRIVNASEVKPLLLSLGIPEKKIGVIYSMYIDNSTFHP